MSHFTPRFFLSLGLGLLVTACGGGGGGGGSSGGGGGGGGNNGGGSGGNSGGGSIGASKADNEVKTYATIGTDGSFAQVDLVNGGNPTSQSNFDVASQNFLNTITTTKGADLDKNLANLPGSGALNATGFDIYSTGLNPGDKARRILGANNLYDLFQTTTGTPKISLISPTILPGFVFNGYTGGDIDSGVTGGNAAGDGGPGLLSNVPNSQVPKLPPLPYTMGDLTPLGSGRGPSPTDQHQFIQIVFPYDLDRDSLFDANDPTNSFLGDSNPLAPDNVFIEARWVQHPPGDQNNAVDQTAQHRHVSGVAIIGGVTAVPYVSGTGTTLATIDATISNVPAGAQALMGLPNVFTYIAHENPSQITTGGSANASGFINSMGVLVLPNPTSSPGGGRVMGCNSLVPGAVNDFAASGDENAAPMGFVYWKFTSLRTKGESVANPYFHSFPLSQAKVGTDTRAILVPPQTVNRTFNRGAAIEIVPTTAVPGIDILDIAKDAITPSTYSLSPDSDADPTNVISTRARFRIDFDKEVVPNSVGLSRNFTIHSTDNLGVIFPFKGNARPSSSPAGQFITGTLGAPLAPSVYVAINQPAGENKTGAPALTGFPQRVNSPYAKSGFGTKDGGLPFTPTEAAGNGLVPTKQNTLATLPRGVVPFDIYPINQNNLQAYVVEPLVEFPPNTIVTVGVCMPGLGMSSFSRTNRGNQTRAGTVFTTFQGLNVVGLGDPNTPFKPAILGNQTVIKVNAGPMDLEGLLMYGGTTVAVDTLVDKAAPPNDLTTGGYNVCRTFKVGQNNKVLYVNAPVSPQALYLGYSTGGAGVLDLSGTGYNTNVPGGAKDNIAFKNYVEVSRFLPPTLTGAQSKFNYSPTASFADGGHLRAFGILGRYTSGGSLGTPPGTESEYAIGAAIATGSLTPTPGINEGSSGYETLVYSGITENNPATATSILTPPEVSIVRDMQVGDFLDKIYHDPENAFGTGQQHRTYNTPAQGAIGSNTIADPPFPNPPPLRYPVGLPHTAVIFNQSDLSLPPFIINGNEAFPSDGIMGYDDGVGTGFSATAPSNGLIQLNVVANNSNLEGFDIPPLPKAGFVNTFPQQTGSAGTPDFVQTGPMPKTATAGAVVLTTINAQAPGTAASSGLVAPIYESRQQIGNYLFVADGVNRKLHALNSNTMQVIRSLSLPDPYGLGLSPDLERLYVSNEGDNSLSIVDADPTSTTFMTELKRVPVGVGPRAVCVDPDNEDVFVLNYLANTVTIVDVNSGNVRKTLSQQGLNRPYDMACGMREALGGPAFQSGTYHGYISNYGANNVLVFQSGPSGIGGIGYDSIVGSVRPNEPPTSQVFKDMFEPRGIVYDPNAPADSLSATIGCFVAHKDGDGKGVVSRIDYTKDILPGQQVFSPNNFLTIGFGGAIFETTAQYLSTFPAAAAYSVALPDYNRTRFALEDFATYFNLLNAGATPKQIPSFNRNAKYPLADNILPAYLDGPRWDPDRVYLSLSGKIIEVFELSNGAHLKTITTPRDVSVLTTYFSQ